VSGRRWAGARLRERLEGAPAVPPVPAAASDALAPLCLPSCVPRFSHYHGTFLLLSLPADQAPISKLPPSPPPPCPPRLSP
jgi:hypothetical protein